MRFPRRSTAATVSAAVVALSLPVLAVLGAAGPASAAAPGQIRITEWAYSGSEFFELTNVGLGAQDTTGWSYSDSAATPGAVDLSAFGRVAPGESVIVAEVTAELFRTAWGLPDTVKVIGGNSVNLGRSDEITIYDESDAQVDRLTYNDEGVGDVAGPRTNDSSAWVPEAALGLNTASAWTKSTLADAEDSWANTTVAGVPAFYGSPGISTLGGFDAASNNSPDGLVRITEWAYSGDEFFELTNIGQAEQDLTDWSYSDSAEVPGAMDLSAFGTVAAGESVIVSEVAAADFRTAWGLPDTVKVIGGNLVNLGRSDEINVYDAADALVDRLTYNDEGVGDVVGPRTNDSSAWVTAPVLGKNVASGWVKSTLDDAEGSYAHAAPLTTFFASPGTSNFGFASGTSEPGDTIRINEVESNGDVVGDWVELTNTGDTAVDVSGWKLRDSGDTNPTVSIPSGVVIAPGDFYAIYTEIPPPGFGLGTTDEVTLFKSDGSTVVDHFDWADEHAATTYGRCPDGTGDFRVTTVGTRGGPNACSPIRVNEIDTASTPDQVEIVNISDAPIDIAGWVLKDSSDVDPTTLPAPSVVPAHGYLVIEPNAVLDATDSVRLLDDTSALIDSAIWDSEPLPSLGRCADGVGAFKLTSTATIGAVNDCPGVQTTPWPGSQTVAFSDDEPTFGQDASGLAFDPVSANTLWVAQNKLGTLWKMTKSGSTWGPAPGWVGGKNPQYADGTGAPDTEGVTVGPDGAVYLTSERNNDASGVSKNTVLRYAASSAAGATLSATDEWDVNPLLPSLGANLGLEGITWVPDQFLVAGSFVDDTTGLAYAPSHYPAHGTGLYVVAVEGTGLLYVLALDQTAAVHETAHLVATIDPRLLTNAGPPGVMDVSFDPELQRLWAICDDSCDGTLVQLTLTAGEFVVEHAYERPAGMPNLNNEGFALAPQSTCLAGAKEVVWADDGDEDGHALRSGTFPCTVPPAPPVVKKTAIVSASATSIAYGKAASIPVTVSAVGVVPTGTVTVTSGATTLGSATLANGSAAVTVPAKSLAPGTHTLTVAYGGDSAVDSRTGTVTLTVVRAAATMAKPTVKPKRIVVRKTRARVTISVLADGVVPTGLVVIKGGGLKQRTVALGADGKVVAKLRKFATKGRKRLTVTYLGDTYVDGASIGLRIRVRPPR